MISRYFTKKILASKLHATLRNWNSIFVGIHATPEGKDRFKVFLTREPTSQEDQELDNLVNAHIPSSSLEDEKELTDNRNKEGLELYKYIFAHISDNEPITSIDRFIEATEPSTKGSLHTLRHYLKDGNYETTVRYMYVRVRPIALGEDGNGMFPQGFEHYRQKIKDIAIKYRPELAMINPNLVGTPFEGLTTIDYIELAPWGTV